MTLGFEAGTGVPRDMEDNDPKRSTMLDLRLERGAGATRLPNLNKRFIWS
jgi:hypothetical protein